MAQAKLTIGELEAGYPLYCKHYDDSQGRREVESDRVLGTP